MTVLITNFKQNMQDKEGFMSTQEMLNECNSHIFKGCLKIKPKNSKEQHFSQWLAYWEGFPYAVLCTVSAVCFPNSDVKVTILTKELKTIEEVGEYKEKTNSAFGEIVDGKFISNKNLTKYVNDVIVPKVKQQMQEGKNTTPAKAKSSTESLSDDKVQEFSRIIAENWGCKLKQKR